MGTSGTRGYIRSSADVEVSDEGQHLVSDCDSLRRWETEATDVELSVISVSCGGNFGGDKRPSRFHRGAMALAV